MGSDLPIPFKNLSNLFNLVTIAFYLNLVLSLIRN